MNSIDVVFLPALKPTEELPAGPAPVVVGIVADPKIDSMFTSAVFFHEMVSVRTLWMDEGLVFENKTPELDFTRCSLRKWRKPNCVFKGFFKS